MAGRVRMCVRVVCMRGVCVCACGVYVCGRPAHTIPATIKRRLSCRAPLLLWLSYHCRPSTSCVSTSTSAPRPSSCWQWETVRPPPATGTCTPSQSCCRTCIIRGANRRGFVHVCLRHLPSVPHFRNSSLPDTTTSRLCLPAHRVACLSTSCSRSLA